MTRKQALLLTSIAALVVGIAVVAYLMTPRPIELRLRELNAETYSQALGPFQRLSYITNVHVDSDEFSDADLDSIAALGTLESVTIQSDRVTDAGIASLRLCSDLRSLMLYCPNISDNGLAVLSELPHLTSLDIASDNITGDCIREHDVSNRLRFLELHGERVDDRACQRLRRFAHLEVADFSGSKVTDEGLALLAEHPRIIEIDVRWTVVTEAGVNRVIQTRPDLVIAWTDE